MKDSNQFQPDQPLSFRPRQRPRLSGLTGSPLTKEDLDAAYARAAESESGCNVPDPFLCRNAPAGGPCDCGCHALYAQLTTHLSPPKTFGYMEGEHVHVEGPISGISLGLSIMQLLTLSPESSVTLSVRDGVLIIKVHKPGETD